MAAAGTEQTDLGGWLVQLGQLGFDDFCLLDSQTLAAVFAANRQLPSADWQDCWTVALTNAPHVLCHLKIELAGLDPAYYAWPEGELTLARIDQAKAKLVRRCAFELLRAKAPPLWDALPWNEWKFEPILRQFPLWRTRWLLAGDGTSVILPRLRKSAGVIVLEPLPLLRRYLEAKAAKERVRRLRILDPAELMMTQSGPVADVALLGSFSLPTAVSACSFEPLLSIPNIFVVENNPLRPALGAAEMAGFGFVRSQVEVRGLGVRPLWTRRSRSANGYQQAGRAGPL